MTEREIELITSESPFRAVTERNIHKTPQWARIPAPQRHALRVVSQVLPFRTNPYVLSQLIDWDRLPEDPIYQLTVPQREMLAAEDFATIEGLLARQAPRDIFERTVHRVRLGLNPHPAGQATHNVPTLDGHPITGLQHKYRETVLFFPAQGQTCHAYCTYCFRWPQFVHLPAMRFEAREADGLVSYLRQHPEVTDVLVTGGDPMIMKTRVLRRVLEPLLAPDLAHVQSVRIGSKALAYWPQRFVSDDDADDLLRLFEEVVAAGRNLALMAHYSHPRELATPMARRAVRRVRSTGAVIRMQAPLIRHVNDSSRAWADLWREGVRLGMIPYYMFVERNTGAKAYFEVPLARAHRIFRGAIQQVSGLSRTVRGPSMSAFPGKIRVLGVQQVREERVFVLEFLQGRSSQWVGRPFFARYDPEATWLDDLSPAFGEERFFFEEELQEMTGQGLPRLSRGGFDPSRRSA